MSADQIRVFVADDHDVLNDSLEAVFSKIAEFNFVGKARDSEQLLSCLRHKKVDVLLLDLYMPGVNEVQFVSKIRTTNSEVKVIMLTSKDDIYLAEEALRHGARGYVSKSVRRGDLVNAIKDVYRGNTVINVKPTDPYNSRDKESIKRSLTDREKQIICLMCKGFKLKEIAEILHIAVSTIDIHKRNIRNKLSELDISTDASLGFWAANNGICEDVDFS